MFRKQYEAEVLEDSPVDAFHTEKRFRFRWMACIWAKWIILTKCKALRSRYWIYLNDKVVERGHYYWDLGCGEWIITKE